MIGREISASHTWVQPFRTASPVWSKHPLTCCQSCFPYAFPQEFGILPPSPLLESFFGKTGDCLSLCLASFWRQEDPVSVPPPLAFPSASRMFSPWHLGSASVWLFFLKMNTLNYRRVLFVIFFSLGRSHFIAKISSPIPSFFSHILCIFRICIFDHFSCIFMVINLICYLSLPLLDITLWNFCPIDTNSVLDVNSKFLHVTLGASVENKVA